MHAGFELCVAHEAEGFGHRHTGWLGHFWRTEGRGELSESRITACLVQHRMGLEGQGGLDHDAASIDAGEGTEGCQRAPGVLDSHLPCMHSATTIHTNDCGYARCKRYAREASGTSVLT